MGENPGHEQPSATTKQIPTLPPNVLIKNEKGEEERSPSNQRAAAHTNDSDKPSFFQTFMQRHFPEARAHDRWTLVFTAVIAISTFLYTIFAGWTLIEISSSSSDTHALAIAASKQADHTGAMADAANKISGAADRFSDSADAINQQTRDAVGKFDRMAKASEKSQLSGQKALDASISSAQLDQRAWVGISEFRVVQFEVDKPIKIDMDFVNNGKTPALNVRWGPGWAVYNVLLSGPTMKELLQLAYHPAESIPPQGRFTRHFELSPESVTKDWVRITSKKAYFYIYGSVLYKDVSTKTVTHETEFCARLSEADTPTPKLVFCESYNDMN